PPETPLVTCLLELRRGAGDLGHGLVERHLSGRQLHPRRLRGNPRLQRAIALRTGISLRPPQRLRGLFRSADRTQPGRQLPQTLAAAPVLWHQSDRTPQEADRCWGVVYPLSPHPGPDEPLAGRLRELVGLVAEVTPESSGLLE